MDLINIIDLYIFQYETIHYNSDDDDVIILSLIK